MNKIISKNFKGFVLAGITAATVSSAQAQYSSLGGTYSSGDAVAGFTTGSGNELIVNLGLVSSLQTGEQWNLSTLLGSGSGNAGFSSLNGLNWGVLGITGSGRSFTSYSTLLGGTANTSDSSGLITLFGSGQINSSGFEVDSAGSQNSWYNNVQTSNSGQSDSPYIYLGGSLDSLTPPSGSFNQTASWFQNTGIQATEFSLGNNGVLTFEAVPEPPTYALVTVAGLLFLAIRRRFARA